MRAPEATTCGARQHGALSIYGLLHVFEAGGGDFAFGSEGLVVVNRLEMVIYINAPEGCQRGTHGEPIKGADFSN